MVCGCSNCRTNYSWFDLNILILVGICNCDSWTSNHLGCLVSGRLNISSGLSVSSSDRNLIDILAGDCDSSLDGGSRLLESNLLLAICKTNVV